MFLCCVKNMKLGHIATATVICTSLLSLALAISEEGAKVSYVDNRCFCQLKGKIDDCQCDVGTVDYFNNKKIFPRLQSLLRKPFFRYFQYNANKQCPFWGDLVDKCVSVNCHVRSCKDDEIPPVIKGERTAAVTHKVQSRDSCPNVTQHLWDERGDLEGIDDTISETELADLKSWLRHDQNEQNFCDLDGELCPDCDVVDLTLNPERYTGYSGEPAHRIWRAIYEENCFRPPAVGRDVEPTNGGFSAAFLQDKLDGMCLEKRVFYRAVSGLHSSITIHLSANYPQMRADAPFMTNPSLDMFGPNVEKFQSRFDPINTNNQGPFWLNNLYFVYLLELRALTKVAPYLELQTFYTGRDEEDKETLIAVKELLNLMRSFPDHFDETTMFSGDNSLGLKREFREHFLNISRIMDCVGCDKCKLWGKLQITGLGTALKILFSDSDAGYLEKLTTMEPPQQSFSSQSHCSAHIVDLDSFKLTRNEIVALFNAFGRISTSIHQLELFREKLHD